MANRPQPVRSGTSSNSSVNLPKFKEHRVRCSGNNDELYASKVRGRDRLNQQEEEEMVEMLETQANSMAQMLLRYRSTFLNPLKSVLAIFLTAQGLEVPAGYTSAVESGPSIITAGMKIALTLKFRESRINLVKFMVLLAAEEYQVNVLLLVSNRRLKHMKEHSLNGKGKKRKRRHICYYCKRNGFLHQLLRMINELILAYNLSLVNHIRDMFNGSGRPDYEAMNQREGVMTETMAVRRLFQINGWNDIDELKYAACMMEDVNYRELFQCLTDEEIIDVTRLKMELKM